MTNQDSMFRHRLQLRRWAARVLLLWLFGIGAGIANACLAPSVVQPGGHVAVRASDQGVAHHKATAPGIGHHNGSSQAQPIEGTHDQPGHAAKSNCVDFCDKASISIPPLKSALDDSQAHALPLAALVTGLPVPMFLPVQQRVPRRDGVWAPPIPITILRLTL